MTSGAPGEQVREDFRQRLGKVSLPHWTVSMSIFAGAIGSTIVGATAKDPELANAFQSTVTPILGLFAGAAVNDLYHRLGNDRQLEGDVKKSADATLIMLENVLQVEEKLAEASDNLNEDRPSEAVTSVQVALAMTAVTLRQVRQNLRLWKSLSPNAVDQARHDFQLDETPIAPPKRQEIELPTASNRKGDDGND